MGKTLLPLSSRPLKMKAIFDRRFVVEAVEDFHIHYRNLRISLNKEDFMAFCSGCAQALQRWSYRGCPENPPAHIELSRKQVTGENTEGIRINLNENLYNKNAGRIFSEGSEFEETEYIHLKLRDIRLELSMKEFKELENAVKEASGRLASRSTGSVL